MRRAERGVSREEREEKKTGLGELERQRQREDILDGH